MSPTGSRKPSTGNRSFLIGSPPRSLAAIMVERQAARAKERADRVQQVVKPYSPHKPSPTQQLFLSLDAEEVFYGGAAGGSKTDSLILAALQYIDQPNYSAGLFRQTEVDLYVPGSIGARCVEWFTDTPAKWEHDGQLWRFPSGASIHLGGASSLEKVAKKYQGAEFQFIGCEELGQWTEPPYLYLFSRLRRLKNAHVPLRMRPAGNPGGRGADWVRRRFIESARHTGNGMTVKDFLKLRKQGQPLPEPRVFLSPPSAQAIAVAREFGREAQGVYFVPAFARDNPGLDVAEYMLMLSKLDPATREQLEHGDWWASGGGDFFKADWFNYADWDDVPPRLRWIRAWDLAATEPNPENLDPDWTAGVKMSIENLAEEDAAKRVWIGDCTRFRLESGDVEKRIKALAQSDGYKVPIYIEQEGGAGGKNTTFNYASKVLFGWEVIGERKTGSKQTWWKPLAADAKNGLVTLVNGNWTTDFVRELCALKDDMTHAHDDQADAAALARAKLLVPDALDKLRRWRKA